MERDCQGSSSDADVSSPCARSPESSCSTSAERVYRESDVVGGNKRRRRIGNGPRGHRFAVTYFGESGRGDGGERKEEKEEESAGCSPVLDDERQEAGAIEPRSPRGDASQVSRGDGGAGPGVPHLPSEAERLSAALRARVEADKQVNDGSLCSVVCECNCPFLLSFDKPCCPLHFC